MKKVQETIGIDVSKNTLDVWSYHGKAYRQFGNTPEGFKQLLFWAKKQGINLSQSLICFEHTGWYCVLLSIYLAKEKIRFCCVNPMEIKRSIGLKRGKSDKADAKEIARYAWLHREELEPSQAPSPKLIELQRMMSFREQLAKQLRSFKCLQKGMDVLTRYHESDITQDMLAETILHIEKQITTVEKQMLVLIKSQAEYNQNYKLSKSVKGVGLVLAVQMLLHTHNYSRFSSWRQFSAYCGLVPYPHQSGTSLNGKMRTHPISDRKMKSLLSMAAISAIQHDKELKRYYTKRVEEGKPKMVALNIIRNKLVARIFATVSRGTPYVELYQYAA